MLTESECARIRFDVEARLLKKLRSACHPMPSDVIGPIRIDMMRHSVPSFMLAADVQKPTLVGVRRLDRDDLIALFPLRRLTLRQALERAGSPRGSEALRSICAELSLAAKKQWGLKQVTSKQLTAAEVPAATAAREPDFTREVLETRIATVLRGRGTQMVPLLQKLIEPAYERLCPYYPGTPHITQAELAALDPGKPNVRARALYPSALLSDIADLVTGYWGHVLGRVAADDVKSCMQRRIRRTPGTDS
jgi:hypothetical protein